MCVTNIGGKVMAPHMTSQKLDTPGPRLGTRTLKLTFTLTLGFTILLATLILKGDFSCLTNTVNSV